MGVATICLVLSKDRPRLFLPLVGFFIVVAGGHHPMALGCLLGLLALIPDYRHSKIMSIAIVCLLCAFVFRLLWFFQILQCDEGGWACLEQIAMGSSETIGWMEVIFRVFHDRFWTEMGYSSVIVILGVVFSWKEPRFGWVILSFCGLFLLGFLISTLRPYHLRILAVPMYVFAILGWQKIGKKSWPVLCIGIFGLWFSSAKIIGIRGGAHLHDSLAREILQTDGVFWFAEPEKSPVYPAAIGLSAILSGYSTGRFSSSPRDDIIVFRGHDFEIIPASNVEVNKLSAGHDWAITIFSSQKVSIEMKN